MLLCSHHPEHKKRHPPATAFTGPPADDHTIADRRGLLGGGDEDDVQFLEALKGLVDCAVKLLGADKGVGTWLMSGLLRKSGMVDVRWIGFISVWVFLIHDYRGSSISSLVRWAQSLQPAAALRKWSVIRTSTL